MKILNSSSTTTMKVDYSSLILRFVAGGFMLYGHGLPKLTNLMSGDEIQFVDLLGLGAVTTLVLVVIAEFLCALFLMLGLFTRWVVVPLILTMAYAAFVFHQADDFGTKEKPMLFLAMFIAIFLIGPGKHSFDRIIEGRKKKTI